MKTSKLAVVATLFLGLASASFAGPGAAYFQRRAKSPAAPPAAAVSADTADKNALAAKHASCGKCRDVTTYQPSPNGRTKTRVVKHECCGC